MEASPKITLVYARSRRINGQQMASELLADALGRARIGDSITIPVFERERNLLGGFGSYVMRWLYALWKLLHRTAGTEAIIHINIGQSLFALVRDMFLLGSTRIVSSGRYVVALHGSWFLDWPERSLEFKIFRFICARSLAVTCLGPRQKRLLSEKYGLASARVYIYDNTCVMEPSALTDVLKKHEREDLRILFLSNLIASKGYRELLEATLLLASEKSCEIIMAGELLHVGFVSRQDEAEQWINARIVDIRAKGIAITWLRRSVGESEKALLFAWANAFVFPSRIEAQPIVLIEAMASGCAIVTSTAGEISAMFSPDDGIFLSTVEPASIAKAISNLVKDPELRRRLGLRSRKLFEARFTRRRFAERGLEIFEAAVFSRNVRVL